MNLKAVIHKSTSLLLRRFWFQGQGPPPSLKSLPPQHKVVKVDEDLGEMVAKSMRRLLELELLYDDPPPKRRLILKHALRGEFYDPNGESDD